ncbi:MAG: shikimate dehydrogenase [Bacteroidota bacterium]
MSSPKKMLGLVGNPLSHSFSKNYFTDKFTTLNISEQWQYKNFELKNLIEITDVIARHDNLVGFNVTIPYKEKIIDFLDELDELAQETKAVNTVKITRNKNGEVIKLKGYNTDVTGFKNSIKPFLEPQHQKALILGTGGASKAVQSVLKSFNIPFWLVTQKEISTENQLNYNQLTKEIISACALLINTTPVGMFPNIDEFPPIPYEGITNQHLVIDLIYNPEKTEFLKKAEQNGAQLLNGYSMLQQQAEAAWQIWNGK